MIKVHSIDEIKDFFAQIGYSQESENISTIQDFVCVLKSVIYYVLEKNNSCLPSFTYVSMVKKFDRKKEDKLVKYESTHFFTMEADFSQAVDCRIARDQIRYIISHIEAERVYHMELAGMGKYRIALKNSFKDAERPRISKTVEDSLTLDEKGLSKLSIFIEVIKNYLIEPNNFDTAVKT